MAITTSASIPAGERPVFTFAPLPHLDQARELVAAIQQLSLARSISDIQGIVRTAARRLTGADGATFVLRDGESCYYVDESAIAPLWKGQRFPMQSCISGWTMLNRRPAAIEDIYADDRIPHGAYRPTFVKSLAMVPIRTAEPVGAIGTYWASRHRPTEEEVELLQALADSTAVAMENVLVYRQLEEARQETLQRLALAGEYRDDATHEHTERVGRTAELVARRLGLAPAATALIRQAAPLHDIGKLAVSDAVLRKPGPLTAHEFEQVKLHAVAGATILSASSTEVLRLAQEIALSHHEWWDGSGYPAGVQGIAIPLSGRIVALADVFDALTHTRPYKAPWSVERAVAEVKRLRGSQFDPDVVDAFLTLDPGRLVAPIASRVP
jgi:putative two-component system response regulator